MMDQDFPEELVLLETAIFEGLIGADTRTWPGRFSDALKPGTDLSLVWPRFAVWMLSSDDLGLPRHADQAGKLAIGQVVALHQRTIDADNPAPSEWWAARVAASLAARSATSSDASAAAAWAASSVAQSSVLSAVSWAILSAAQSLLLSAAQSDEWFSLRSAARAAAYVKMADRPLALMAKAPIAID